MTKENSEFGTASIQAAETPTAGGTLPFFGRVVLATLIAWIVSQILNQVLIGERLIPLPPMPGIGSAEYVGMIFLSSFLVTAAVAFLAQLSSLRGIALIQALAIAHFGLNHLLTMVEATVFLTTMTAREVGLSIFAGAIQSTVLAVCVVAVLGKLAPSIDSRANSGTVEPMSKWEWTWKFATCAIAYVFLYISAGLMILPLVREYYPELAEHPMDPVFMIGLQIRRGIVYVACLVPIIRSFRASRIRIALAIAVFVPLVHGVAGLLVPSEHMGPMAWRIAHMLEIGWSNFVFGLLIGWLFSRGTALKS